jgi:hypothetical protein
VLPLRDRQMLRLGALLGLRFRARLGGCVPLSRGLREASVRALPMGEGGPDSASEWLCVASTSMLRKSASVVSVSIFLAGSVTSAQTGAIRSTVGSEDGASSSDVICAGVAVFSAGGGPEVHVVGRGSLDQRNPLAPLTDAPPATVLAVTIKGKSAATYGPSFQEMRRAGPPQDLEREMGNAIQWEANLASLPHQISILGDDNEIIAKLRYVKCLPRKKAPPARPSTTSRPGEVAPATREQAPAFPVPQGAMK